MQNFSDELYISALQINRAVLYSTAIIIAAFVPLFTMQGVEGKIFGPMATTYAYALAGALIATFTITPVLASLLMPEHVNEADTFLVRTLRGIYTPVLRWAVVHRGRVVALGLTFLAGAGVVMLSLGSEFLPALEEGNLWIRASMPPTISLEAGMPTVSKIRKTLLTYPEVITVVSQHGRPDNGSDATGFFNAEFFVPLKPFDQWPNGIHKDKLIEDMQKQFSQDFTGIDFNFSQYIQDNIEEGLSGIKGANSIKIIGPDLVMLEKIGSQVLGEMQQVKGATDLGLFRVLGQPNLNIKFDRQRSARYGLNAGDINTVVQAALGGVQATTVMEGDRQLGLTVRAAPESRASIEAVRNIKVGYALPGGGNAYVPLSELATVSLDTGASYIFHERNQRVIAIKFSVRDRDLGSTVQEAQARITKNIELPPGYRIEWAGEFGEMEAAKERLAVMIPLSLFLIVVLLYALFNSMRDSLLVLMGIPFAAAGGGLALWLANIDLSVSAAIGFISLFGVSVMNGILILTQYNKLRINGIGTTEAMIYAAEQQMRPMLMMALSACIGLLPAAISTGIGSEVQRPLATVVVGGMLIGPIMMLVVVPALQLFFLKGSDGQPQTESAKV